MPRKRNQRKDRGGDHARERLEQFERSRGMDQEPQPAEQDGKEEPQHPSGEDEEKTDRRGPDTT